MITRVCALALFIVVGAAAAGFACTNISTLNLSDSAGRPGDRVDITGSSFGNSSPSGRRTAEPLPVRIRWNDAEGPTLAEVVPDGTGNISAAITIPGVTPGRYVIFAVQQDRDGYHMYGTPARAAYEVFTPDGGSVPPGAVSQAEGSSDGREAWDVPLLLAVLGVLGGALFVAGFAAFMRLLSPGVGPSASRVSS